jgi:hypothetical protein
MLTTSHRMGELECKSPHTTTRSYIPLKPYCPSTANTILTFAVARHLSVHAMRSPASQAGDAHLQGQVSEYG